MITCDFVDHLVFRVSSLSATEEFYNTLFGEPSHRSADSVMYMVGPTRLFFTITSRSGTHDKEQLGLNHIAFGAQSLEDLRSIDTQLTNSRIKHSGIRIDSYGQTEFIWLDDPDGLRIEFFVREL